jgi:hypothetical protein
MNETPESMELYKQALLAEYDGEDLDDPGLDTVARMIADQLAASGIFVRDWKEKHGTVRVYCDIGDEHIPAYKAAYAAAIARWPHLRDEIVDGADYLEYLNV